jgi:hypothetical protein
MRIKLTAKTFLRCAAEVCLLILALVIGILVGFCSMPMPDQHELFSHRDYSTLDAISIYEKKR